MNCIQFNMNGDLLLSGSDDQTVKIWDVFSSQCLETLRFVFLWGSW